MHTLLILRLIFFVIINEWTYLKYAIGGLFWLFNLKFIFSQNRLLFICLHLMIRNFIWLPLNLVFDMLTGARVRCSVARLLHQGLDGRGTLNFNFNLLNFDITVIFDIIF